MQKKVSVSTAKSHTSYLSLDDSDQEEDEILVVESPDLPAKDIRALVAVACYLCQSANHPEVITAQHIKENLYQDKQDSIPPAAMEIAAKLTTAVRALTPNKDQAFSFASWFQMRSLRNTLVEFSGSLTKRKVIKLAIVKEKHTQDPDAVRIDAAALYHLFSRTHRIYQSNGHATFTSIHSAKTQEQKSDILNNFIRMNYVHKILQEQKLIFAGYFMFINQYHLDFSGYKITQHVNQPTLAQQAEQPAMDEKTKEANKQTVKALSIEIKGMRTQYTSMSKELKKLEVERMAAGNKSRKFEKRNKRRDATLYGALRQARQAFNQVHMSMSKLQQDILDKQSTMYLLNKRINGQPTPQQDPPPDASLVSIIAKPNTVVQGIDPGIVTTASGITTTSMSLLEHVNRFQALSSDTMIPHPKDNVRAFNLTANFVNNATLANKDRRAREKKTQTLKRKQKDRVKRKSRLKKCYQRKVASDRVGGKEPCVTFIGNWSGSSKYIKGHTRRGTRRYYQQLGALDKDSVLLVDEYRSTVTCSSCFQRTSKQPHMRDGKLKRIPGAVVCHNVRCPRRLTTRATTTNRDGNGALNIAVIGFSRMASSDGLPLPPFRRSLKSNK